ncbi:uncharacterized protein Bfra_007133 [Botrytis fragariae]|uniref:Lysine-specific metallo-endopeptidase domain-containing protein n=1 Tax=Botrytis fragariae TaxID=1964551 RepID=A0A8H6AHJ3_9HELO|nr:uncharacterized protein Bfra_007133 [Botrytis fragariae]KAF5867938.1 hypothetical protein Bfra_007133 [Botrytis fragariae]
MASCKAPFLMMYNSSLSVTLLLAFLAWLAGLVIAHGDEDHDHEYEQSYDTINYTGNWEYLKRDCSSRDLNLINAELTVAASMASYAQANLDSTTGALYTSAFIPPDLISSADIIAQLANEYGNVAAMKDGSNYEFTVTCDDTNRYCTDGYYAYMSDTSRSSGTMNLCSAWFDITGTPAASLKNIQNLVSTADIISGCMAVSPGYNNLDNVWWGRGQTLLHEWTHTRYFTGSSSKTLDFAYGVQGCLNLAAGSHSISGERAWKNGKNGRVPRCPSKEDPTEPGICDPYLSIDNADTLSIIAGGLWYSDKAQCNRVLPIGLVAAAPPTRKYKGKRQSPGNDENEVALDPPYYGDDLASLSCESLDPKGCCGGCENTTNTSLSVSAISTSSILLSAITSAPTSHTSTTSTSLPSITGALPCLMHEDPDAGTPPICQCSNGINIPPIISTNTAGKIGKYCPWATLPTQAMTTTKPSAPPTTAAPYQFTYTDPYGKVELCQSTLITHLAGYTLTECKGTAAVIYNPPTASMEMGSSKVNVGTSMTGEILFTSVSNALTSLCPTPTTSGAWTTCQTGTIELGDATWLNDNSREDGKVTIKVTDAQYNTTDYLDMFIRMIASTANATATGDNCELLEWDEITWKKRDANPSNGQQEPTTERGGAHFCNTNGFLDTQFYDGIQETAKMWFETEFGFDLGELGNFDCASSVDLVGEVLGNIFDAIFPEFIWLIETGVKLGEIACEAAETFNPTRLLIRDSEISIADEQLAKAWAKEIKKERMLPMPERKKRELGLIE